MSGESTGRGYTIGKTLNVVNDQQEKLQPKDNDGFMPISIVKVNGVMMVVYMYYKYNTRIILAYIKFIFCQTE